MQPTNRCIIRLRFAARLAGVGLGVVFAGQAMADGPFDGTYDGTQTRLVGDYGTGCRSPARDTARIVIKDNHFAQKWGTSELSVDVSPDGAFYASDLMRDTRKQRITEIKGKITGDDLEADIGSSHCASHLSLKKS